jgi:putative flippase GtrA
MSRSSTGYCGINRRTGLFASGPPKAVMPKDRTFVSGFVPDVNAWRNVQSCVRSRVWLRFVLVGIINTVFGYLVFALLVLAGVWPGSALIVTTVAGVAFNFQTTRRLVFHSDGPILRFVTVYSIVLILDWIALRGLRSCGLTDLGAQALLTLPIAAISFVGQQKFVFAPVARAT